MRRLGYLLPEKKAQVLGLCREVKERLKSSGIETVAINENIPIEKQGPFDIILHKLSDYKRDAEKGNTKAIRIIEEMKNYELKNKNTCIFIDSIDLVFDLANRDKMCKICEQATFETNDINVFVPPWIVIDVSDNLEQKKNELLNLNISYPLLCKALDAAEGSGAHDMQLIFNENQLMNELKVIPCIAQSFINHDMNMRKIFVVGKTWCVVNRPSIRNLNSKKIKSSIEESIYFDSHEVSKPDSSSFLNKYGKDYHQHVSFGNDELLKDTVVNELIERLRKIINFTLLGIDVIIKDHSYGLIDINFLPGYDGMKNLYDELYNVICSKLNNVEAVKNRPLFHKKSKYLDYDTYSNGFHCENTTD